VRGIGSKLENQRRSKMVSKGLRHYNRRIYDPRIDLPGTPDPEEFLITGGMERGSALHIIRDIGKWVGECKRIPYRKTDEPANVHPSVSVTENPTCWGEMIGTLTLNISKSLHTSISLILF